MKKNKNQIFNLIIPERKGGGKVLPSEENGKNRGSEPEREREREKVAVEEKSFLMYFGEKYNYKEPKLTGNLWCPTESIFFFFLNNVIYTFVILFNQIFFIIMFLSIRGVGKS